MPPTTDPRRWRILDNMISAFEGMDGTAYFFPPQQASMIVPPLLEYLGDRPASTTTVYGAWVEDEDISEKTTGSREKNLRVFIQTATRYQPRVTDPYNQKNAGQDWEEEIRSKQAHDVEKLIDVNSIAGGGDQFGGLYENWDLLGNDAFQVNVVRVPGWVMTQFETMFIYFNNLGDPTKP